MSRFFPPSQVTQQSAEGIELTLQLSADLYYFSGHFPQAPVLAGIAQLDWAVYYTQTHLLPAHQVLSVEVLKYQEMILPDVTVRLVIAHTKADTTTFAFYVGEQRMSSGRLKWGPHFA